MCIFGREHGKKVQTINTEKMPANMSKSDSIHAFFHWVSQAPVFVCTKVREGIYECTSRDRLLHKDKGISIQVYSQEVLSCPPLRDGWSL